MKTPSGHRLFIGLGATAILSLFFAATAVAFVLHSGGPSRSMTGTNDLTHKVQGSVTVSPNIVETGTSPTVTISASGFFDLSQVRESLIGIRPTQGVSNIQIESATAQRLRLSFTLAPDTVTGTRTLFINNSNGTTIVALDLELKLGALFCQPACRDPLVCRANVCVRPEGCNPPCDDGFSCNQFNRCVTPRCQPPCASGSVCESGRCISNPP